MTINTTPTDKPPALSPKYLQTPTHQAPNQSEPKEAIKDSKTFNENMVQKSIAEGLRSCVDRRGNFSSKLKDISLGLAAGKGLSEYEAKKEVKSVFQKEYGIELQQYLDKHREERGLNVGKKIVMPRVVDAKLIQFFNIYSEWLAKP